MMNNYRMIFTDVPSAEMIKYAANAMLATQELRLQFVKFVLIREIRSLSVSSFTPDAVTEVPAFQKM